MLFTFKRDEEGRERICVGDACVWTCRGDLRHNTGHGVLCDGFNAKTMGDAIESADEAGFWEMGMRPFPPPARGMMRQAFLCNEVTVDVPVVDNAAPSATTAEDQS